MSSKRSFEHNATFCGAADAKQMQKAAGQPEKIKELAAKMLAKLPAAKTKPVEPSE